MEKAFEFLKPGRLVDGDLRLVLVEKHRGDPVKKYVPWYEFDMRRSGRRRRVGRISLRIGPARALRCPGHIGYLVSKRQRGNRYAARSCRLLVAFAYAHGLRALWITCDPKNAASRSGGNVRGDNPYSEGARDVQGRWAVPSTVQDRSAEGAVEGRGQGEPVKTGQRGRAEIGRAATG